LIPGEPVMPERGRRARRSRRPEAVTAVGAAGEAAECPEVKVIHVGMGEEEEIDGGQLADVRAGRMRRRGPMVKGPKRRPQREAEDGIGDDPEAEEIG